MSKQNKGSKRIGPGGRWNSVEAAGASDGDIQRVHDELVHNKESPREGFSPIPIFLVFLLSFLIVFSGIYMVSRSDDFDQLGFNESRRRFAWAEDAAPAEQVDPVVRAGQAVYTQCAACHQQNGQGLPGAFPPLDGTRWVQGSKERLIRVVMNGLMGSIEVQGTTYNGVMPNLGLSDDDIASVLTYIRQAWSNDAGPVTVEEVAAVRAEVGQRSPWSPEELLAAFPLEDPAELESADTEESTQPETP